MTPIDSSRRSARGRGRLRSVVVLLMVVVLTGCAGNSGSPAAAQTDNVRSAQFAGMFYPADPDKLRGRVQSYLDKAEPQVPSELRKRRPAVLVVPHAGYPYSGETAAYAYKLLKDTKKPDRIVLLGPSHRVRMGNRISVPPYTACRTPLGDIPIDVSARDTLAKTDVCISEALVHRREHSLEVQLPFIQTIWEDPPPILPVVAGQLREKDWPAVAKAVDRVVDKDTLVVVSSDFIHYGSRFGFTPFSDASGQKLMQKIKQMDLEAVERMKQCDAAGFGQYVKDTGATICGADPIAVMLKMCCPERGLEGHLLHYATSAEVTSDYGSSVSYVAYAAWTGTKDARKEPEKTAAEKEEGPSGVPEKENPSKDQGGLSDSEKRALLQVARDAIKSYVVEDEKLEVQPEDYAESLRKNGGAFVTLKKDGKLRGCMGYIAAVKPLVEAVADMAVNAACKDRRFKPVRKEEIPDLSIEISVLSPFRKVEDPQNIRVGKHGLIVAKGRRSGLLLPQVATEQGWDRQEFLENTCRKAGLSAAAWKNATLYSFTAQVFGVADLEVASE